MTHGQYNSYPRLGTGEWVDAADIAGFTAKEEAVRLGYVLDLINDIVAPGIAGREHEDPDRGLI